MMAKIKLIKIILDCFMYGDFIFLMSHGTVRNLGFHAYAGIALFILFIAHHLLNIWFYKTTFKGKYTAKRILLSATDWILFALMILMAASSVFATGAVFEWSPMRFNQSWRTIHLMSTSWAYMVMSFHLALHLHATLKKLNSKAKTKASKILLYAAYVLAILAGCFAFYDTQIYYYLFNTNNWKMAAPNMAIAILEYVGITAGICAAVQMLRRNKLSP